MTRVCQVGAGAATGWLAVPAACAAAGWLARTGVTWMTRGAGIAP